VLFAAGIPADRFGSLRSESDAALPGAGQGRPAYRRQSMSVSLVRLTVAEVGEFFSEWVRTQPLWTPTRIDLTHVRDTVVPPLYDMTLIVAATYIGEP
jgi:hypothetical protein